MKEDGAQPIIDRILTPKEVADLLSIKITTLYSHLSRKKDLPAYFRVSSQTRWRESAVWEWIRRKEREQGRKNYEE